MPSRDTSAQQLSGPRRILAWFVRDHRTGRIAVAQVPNPALGVWALTSVFLWTGLFADRAAELGWIGTGALVAWGADEAIRGASPARRLLGSVVLGWQLLRFAV
jgi:hypothetical protein